MKNKYLYFKKNFLYFFIKKILLFFENKNNFQNIKKDYNKNYNYYYQNFN